MLSRPEMRLMRVQTWVVGVKRFKELTYFRHETVFASFIVRRAKARAFLKAIRFSVVLLRSNFLKARFRARIASPHSLVHQGTGVRRGRPDVFGMLPSAEFKTMAVKSAGIADVSALVKMDSSKEAWNSVQSASSVFHVCGLLLRTGPSWCSIHTGK